MVLEDKIRKSKELFPVRSSGPRGLKRKTTYWSTRQRMSPEDQSKNLARNRSHSRFPMELAMLGLSFEAP